MSRKKILTLLAITLLIFSCGYREYFETINRELNIPHAYISYNDSGEIFLEFGNMPYQEKNGILAALSASSFQIDGNRKITEINGIPCAPWYIPDPYNLYFEIDTEYEFSYSTKDEENYGFFGSSKTYRDINCSFRTDQESVIPVFSVSSVIDENIQIDSACVTHFEGSYLYGNDPVLILSLTDFDARDLSILQCGNIFRSLLLSGNSYIPSHPSPRNNKTIIAQMTGFESIPPNVTLSVDRDASIGKSFELISYDPFQSQIINYILLKSNAIHVYQPVGGYSITFPTTTESGDSIHIFIPEMFDFHQQSMFNPMTSVESLYNFDFYGYQGETIYLPIYDMRDNPTGSMAIIVTLIQGDFQQLYIDFNGNILTEENRSFIVNDGDEYSLHTISN